ncbi:hypothetical protein [Vibrio intestinalis]|uniref:hypothetical protein n=1 Tax=Vibrio intestinalis TaxID=2933291 RepID=UPI0021A91864|nr:hypothetical protein [Vibrio intestinalis]
MLKSLFMPVVLIAGSVQAADLQGCFSTEDLITSFGDGQSEMKQSYINIVKQGDDYLVDALLWGANYHICGVGDPTEGADPAPLKMHKVGDKLVYEKQEPEYGISCKLELSVQDEMVNISDENYHCGQYIFSCGARVGLHNVELPSTPDQCHSSNASN